MPFAGFKDFSECVKKNQDKKSPEAFCAYLHHKSTGKWPTEKNVKVGLPNALKCPVCSNPVKVNRANVRLKCPSCRTSLVSVKVKRR